MRLNHSRLAVAPNQTNSLCLFSGNFPKAFFLLLATCWLLAVQGLQAQTTWDGSDNTDWFDADNWSAGIPDATDDVSIPGGMPNQPSIGTDGALAKSVAVAASATLTITVDGVLTINDWADKALSNLGTVNNNGTIVIGSTSSGTGNFGIYNEATFNNNSGSLLTLDRGWVTNLRNLSGTFNNDGTITIGGIVGARYGIWNSATFNNNADGQINIDRASSLAPTQGLSNNGSFHNSGALIIGANGNGGDNGLQNFGTFNNNAGGEIKIDRTSTAGLGNYTGTFNNASSIIIGANAGVGPFGMWNQSATFNNNSGGEIHIDRAGNSGINNESGFTNSATIIIGANGGVFSGLSNTGGSFNNNTCDALLHVADDSPIYLNSGSITNAGRIIENASGNSAISTNSGIVQNLGGGTFSITTNTGLLTTFEGALSACCPPGNIYYVNAAATGANDGTSWADAFTDLQSALLSPCATLTQIWVAEGTYKPTNGTDRTISFVMKPGVEILGGFPNTGDPGLGDRDPNPATNGTVLSGDINTAAATDNSYHVVFNNFTSGSPLTGTAVLDGFTITGGYASGIAPHCHGGGMYNLYASPTVTNCIFSNNTAQRSNATSTDSRGGGMYNSYSAPSVSYCTFSGNEARAVNSSGQNYGGAMYNHQSTMTVSHCTFNNNTTPNSDEDTYGGGMCNINMTITINDCTFSGNAACFGGGVYSSNSATTTNNCTFSANALDTNPGGVNGSGMYLNACSGSVSHCAFTGNLNHAALGIQLGSPIEVGYCSFLNNPVYGMTLQTAAPNITNCLFAGNNFGGLANWHGGVSAPVITNCTFSENPTFPNLGAITNYGTSTATLKNCILWGAGPSVHNPNGVVNISYSDVKQASGIYPGAGNINANPLFVSGTDFHLQNASPCINVGTATGAPATDFDGDTRPQGGGFDMGYDENTTPCIPPTVNAPSVTQPTCALPTGTIVVDASGGGTLEYSVNDGADWQLSENFPGLQPGNYPIKVRLEANPSCEAAYAGNPVELNSPFTPSTTTDTWTGCVSTDWHTAGNWADGSVPTAADDVIIPNVTNDPVISMAAVARQINIGGGGNLMVAASGSLAISGGSGYGIFNIGTVVNEGTISINGISGFGLHNLIPGSFTNKNLLQIGNLSGVGDGIYSDDATFINQGGFITIDRCSASAIKLYTLGFQNTIFTNDGSIIIGSLGTIGTEAISVQKACGGNCQASFSNTSCSALINIVASAANNVITLGGGATFDNNGGRIIENASGNSSITTNSGYVQNLNGGTFSIGTNTGVLTTSTGDIWTGCTSTDWHTAGNWLDGSVPTVADDAVIPDAINDPEISAAAVAKSVVVESGAILTIASAGSLTIDGSTAQGILNQGTVENSGAITIGATANAGLYGIHNRGTFNNYTGGEINTDRSANSGTTIGIWNEIGTFTNEATITIGAIANTSPGVYGLSNSAIFHNNGGEIRIDRSGNNGLTNGGTFNNAAQITIGATADVGLYGLSNSATFNNNIGGEINIDRSTSIGIALWNAGGTFTNAAQITIGAVASVGDYGFRNEATFHNNSGGEISIDRSSRTALWNYSGTFTNAATITIGAVAAVGLHGIRNRATFNNNSGGEINIDQTSTYGLWNYVSAAFTNAANITIGAVASVGDYGIFNDGATFDNSGCGAFINIASNSVIANTGTFSNSGRIRESASGNSSITSNSGTVQNLNGGTFSITTNTGGLTTATGDIWTGCLSTDWHTAGNWFDGSVPTAADNAVVPDAINDPVIGAAAAARSVHVEAGGSLTVEATGSLPINSAASPLFTNSGTVVNEGTISLNTAVSFNFHRLLNLETGTFTNNNVLQLGNSGSQTVRGIYNRGSFVNATGGSISIAKSNGGIFQDAGSFVNNANIVFSSVNNLADSTAIVLFGGTFSNTPCSATILDQPGSNLSRFSAAGGSTFTNDGLLTENSSGFSSITNNTGIVQNLGGGSFNITNNTGVLTTNPGPQTACCPPADIFYVNAAATGANNGSSWADAFTDLQNALNSPCTGITQIWVAEGTYKPTSGTDRSISFSMKNGVEILGGFPNTGDPGLGDRDWVANLTILSGEIGAMGMADNTLNIIKNTGLNLNATAVIDGFQIAFANGTNVRGGGIENGDNSSPTIRNCSFLSNSANFGGAINNNLNCSPTITNCTFTNNTSGIYGGAVMCESGSAPTFTDCTFSNNSSGFGGGIFSKTADLTLNDCDFSNNAATSSAGAVYRLNGTLNANNCTFTSNTAIRNGGAMEVNAGISTITECTFSNNTVTTASTTWGYGGAIFITDGTLNLTDYAFFNSASTSGGGAVCNQGAATMTVERCHFKDNVCHNGSTIGTGGALQINGATATLSNCLLDGNQALGTGDDGGGALMNYSGTLTVINSTIVNSHTARYGGAISNYSSSSTTVVKNTIFSNNTAVVSAPTMYKPAAGSANISHSLIPENTCPTNVVCGAGNLFNVAPFFVSATDFHLQDCSPAIDAANDADAPATDFDQNARFDALPNEGIADMGAYEFQSPATPTVAVCQTSVDAVLDNNGSATVLATALNDGSTGCSPLVFSINGQPSVAFDCIQIGNQPVTLTATYVNRTDACATTVHVLDNTPPTITCPDNIAKITDAGQCSAVATYSVTASDNCAFTLTRTSPANTASGSAFPVGITNVEWSVTDAGGNATSCAFTVTVADEQDPTITCPANISKTTDAGQCSAVATYSVTASDNCAYTLTRTSPAGTASGSAFPVGITNVEWSVTDAGGNATSCAFTVTVTDGQLPGITCPGPATVTCAGNVPAVNLAAVTATDNCGAPVKSHVGDATSNQTCANRKTVTRTYRATDGSGNSASCSQVITVFDNVKPNFTSVPANVTVQCNSVPAVGTATATDGCGGTVTVAYNGQTTESGACTDAYTITRQWTATDACGNTKTATQRINVIDTQKPNFTTMPANITVQCNAIPAPTTPTATDNCDAVVTITYNGQTQTNGACPNAYTLTRTWTAADNCNNTKTVTQRITVVDNGKPVFTAFPANTSITCDETPPAVGSPTASDGCGSATVTYLGQTTVSGNCPGNYQIRRTWRATDACGNSTAATQTISVSDTGAPTFTSTPGPLTIECGDPLPPLVNPTASDACGGYVAITFLGNVPSGSGCEADYTVTRTWRAEDLCGNSATTSQVITVLGNNNFGAPEPEGIDRLRPIATQMTRMKHGFTQINPTEEKSVDIRVSSASSALPSAAFALQPNPTTDRIWLDLTDFAGEAVTISIFSDLGQLIWENRIPAVKELKLSVSLLESDAKAGIYTVSVRSASGVAAKRVVLVE